MRTSEVAPCGLSSAAVVSSCQRPWCVVPGASSSEGHGLMKHCSERVFQAVRSFERWRFGARNMFSGWSDGLLFKNLTLSASLNCFTPSFFIFLNFYTLKTNCIQVLFLFPSYCFLAVTHGRQSSRLQWGSTRTQWTLMWSGWTFWSAALMKEAVCTATDSSARSGVSQPLCERSVGQTEISLLFYCLQHFSVWHWGGGVVQIGIYFTVFNDVFLDPGDQSDRNICEGTLYSWPRREEDGAVLNKCLHLVLPHISMQRCAMGDARWTLAISTMKSFTPEELILSFRLLSPTGFQWTRGLFTDHTPTTLRCKDHPHHCTHLSTLTLYSVLMLLDG